MKQTNYLFLALICISLSIKSAQHEYPLCKDAYIRDSGTQRISGPWNSIFTDPVVLQITTLIQNEQITTNEVEQAWLYFEPNLLNMTSNDLKKRRWSIPEQYAKQTLIQAVIKRCDRFITSGFVQLATFQPNTSPTPSNIPVLYFAITQVPDHIYTETHHDTPEIAEWKKRMNEIQHQRKREYQSVQLKPFVQLQENPTLLFFAKLYRYLLKTTDQYGTIPQDFDWDTYLKTNRFDASFENCKLYPDSDETLPPSQDIHTDFWTLRNVTTRLTQVMDNLERT